MALSCEKFVSVIQDFIGQSRCLVEKRAQEAGSIRARRGERVSVEPAGPVINSGCCGSALVERESF